MRNFWNWLRGRHQDGSKHIWIKSDEKISLHPCEDYCHHYVARCYCGQDRLMGYSVPEVR